MKRLAILGSTGSIGQSTLDVVRAHPDKLKVVGLAAGSNAERLREQAAAFGATITALASTAGSEGLDRGRHASRRRHRHLRVIRHRCARGGACRDRRRQDHRAREQGSARDGRRARHRRRPRTRRRHSSGRQRAQRHSSVPARPAAAKRFDASSSRRRAGRSARCRRRRSRASSPKTHCVIRRGAWAARSRSIRRR